MKKRYDHPSLDILVVEHFSLINTSTSVVGSDIPWGGRSRRDSGTQSDDEEE